MPANLGTARGKSEPLGSRVLSHASARPSSPDRPTELPTDHELIFDSFRGSLVLPCIDLILGNIGLLSFLLHLS